MTGDGLPPLEAIFRPGAVAVVGASDNPEKLGFHVMKSLTQGGYPGKIFPVNPGRNEIFGIKSYPSLLSLSEEVDLAVIVLPAEQALKTIEDCGLKGVKAVILITAGFKEIEDRRGEILQDKVVELANRFGIKIIGPNTFGVINLHLPLNASFTPEFSWGRKGKISLVSQSGGMAHLLAFLSTEGELGLSKIIGLGNRCNVDFGDMVEYLIDDPESEVIALYLEGIDHPRRLMEAAQKARGKKAIVAYKVGRFQTSDRASQFHTGSLAGKHGLYEGAFKQSGVLTVGSSEELLDSSKALAFCPLPKGKRVAVLSGQAGPAIAACDVCEEKGLSLSPFSAETQRRIDAWLPPLAIRTNPVDMGPAWYDSEAIKGIIQSVLDDPNIDAILLCIMFASANKDVVGVLSGHLLDRRRDKPILSCFSAPGDIWEAEIRRLEGSGVPNYPTPERAARSLASLVEFERVRKRGEGHGHLSHPD